MHPLVFQRSICALNTMGNAVHCGAISRSIVFQSISKQTRPGYLLHDFRGKQIVYGLIYNRSYCNSTSTKPSKVPIGPGPSLKDFKGKILPEQLFCIQYTSTESHSKKVIIPRVNAGPAIIFDPKIILSFAMYVKRFSQLQKTKTILIYSHCKFAVCHNS